MRLFFITLEKTAMQNYDSARDKIYHGFNARLVKRW